mmetsp:Transcript_114676/g.199442  ORF Transcript_114676/g.199442 Transcript_114676/m.199442 type:complete len:437 (-) Transcript_114676:166-1476(-)
MSDIEALCIQAQTRPISGLHPLCVIVTLLVTFLAIGELIMVLPHHTIPLTLLRIDGALVARTWGVRSGVAASGPRWLPLTPQSSANTQASANGIISRSTTVAGASASPTAMPTSQHRRDLYFAAVLSMAGALLYGLRQRQARALQRSGPEAAIAMCAFTAAAEAYPVTKLSERLQVYTVPMFDDNYGWLLTDARTKRCVAVDPGEPGPILDAVRALGLKLTRVLITHKHGDHTGGNLPLKANVEGLEVVGTGYEPIPGLDTAVREGDCFDLFGDPDGAFPTSVLATPCHTRGHVVFLVQPEGPGATPALLCGDTLFVGGCGRFFEGDAQQMYTALVQKLSVLPDETLVFCAHEYTESNLKFALQVEPQNVALRQKMDWVQAQRAQGLPTVPSTIAEERTYNPFMRCGNPAVMARVKAADPVECMSLLREGKNRGHL